jgi:hypothetical protein
LFRGCSRGWVNETQVEDIAVSGGRSETVGVTGKTTAPTGSCLTTTAARPPALLPARKKVSNP